jgi:hypothetical protein
MKAERMIRWLASYHGVHDVERTIFLKVCHCMNSTSIILVHHSPYWDSNNSVIKFATCLLLQFLLSTSVCQAFYPSYSLEQLFMLNFVFDDYPEELAFMISNDADKIMFAFVYFGSFDNSASSNLRTLERRLEFGICWNVQSI